MRPELLRFNGAVERDLAIDAWMKEQVGEPQITLVAADGADVRAIASSPGRRAR
jgi:hypothetical protein